MLEMEFCLLNMLLPKLKCIGQQLLSNCLLVFFLQLKVKLGLSPRSTSIFSTSKDDQSRDPNIKDKDYLAG